MEVPYSPEYIEIAQKQRKLKGDAQMIEDSLLARSHQQFTMTSVNNLAVMLSEVLKNMQDEMQEAGKKKPGDKSCDKPGSGKGKKPGKKPGKGKKGKGGEEPGSESGLKKLREMQQGLQKGIKSLKDGQGKPGGQGGMSKELAQMAARQEMIRRELQKLQEQRSKEGKKGLPGLGDLQKQMDKTEEELVNKNLSEETIRRQQEIVTRLLESEKAEKEQDEEERRESKTADAKASAAPPQVAKYKAMKEKETELLRTVPPSLNSYYRKKVKVYFEGVR